MTEYEQWTIALGIVALALQSLKEFLNCDRCNRR